MHRAILILGVLCALVCACAAGVRAQDAPAEGPAELALEDLNGQRASLADYRGRIVVLNFWATWCVPCREEMPLLERLHREYEARGAVVIGASADDSSTQSRIAPFVKKLKLTFPIWRGATTQDMERLSLGTALPATAILDRDGTIAFRILGPVEEPEMRARLDWLLGDRSAPAPDAAVNNFEKAHEGHEHKPGEENHQHGTTALEGASSVPS
jgi:thiol-disulfide isomerase/thioredoxin